MRGVLATELLWVTFMRSGCSFYAVTQWKLTVMPRARKYLSSVLRRLQSR